MSVNASLGSTTHFKCTVQGGLPHWHINGRKLSGIQFLSQRGISSSIVGSGGIRTSSLSVLASVANNNSAVQCSISDGFTEVLFSPTVEMKVQGRSIPIMHQSNKVTLCLQYFRIRVGPACIVKYTSHWVNICQYINIGSIRLS